MIHAMDCILMCMRPESTEKYCSQSEPIICVLIGTVNEGFTVPETVFTKTIFVKICVWSSDSSGIARV